MSRSLSYEKKYAWTLESLHVIEKTVSLKCNIGIRFVHSGDAHIFISRVVLKLKI